MAVLERTSHTLQITFDPPTVGVQCVTEYDIQGIKLDAYSSKDKMIGEEVVPVEPSQESMFTNLMACANYEIRVRSVTRGLLTSEWVSVVTSTLEDVPSAPRSLQLLDATPSTLTVQWWEPMDNYLCVDMYKVVWGHSRGGIEDNLTLVMRSTRNPLQPPMTLPNLDSCTEYNVRVMAVTPGGTESEEASLLASTTGCAR